MTERDALFLEHILAAIARIERYTATGRAAFFADDMIQSAVVRQIEIIGEAVKNLSAGATAAQPDIPWRAIAGTRDRLIHGYFNVKLETVWDVVAKELPALKQSVSRLLAGG
jgi:uncharacterized protein with HEPN domain